jgi:hypothetical protein
MLRVREKKNPKGVSNQLLTHRREFPFCEDNPFVQA